MRSKQSSPHRQLAERIARRLFTNGSAERAQRLVLTIDTPVERNLGGWSERAAADQIELILSSSETPEPRRVNALEDSPAEVHQSEPVSATWMGPVPIAEHGVGTGSYHIRICDAKGHFQQVNTLHPMEIAWMFRELEGQVEFLRRTLPGGRDDA